MHDLKLTWKWFSYDSSLYCMHKAALQNSWSSILLNVIARPKTIYVVQCLKLQWNDSNWSWALGVQGKGWKEICLNKEIFRSSNYNCVSWHLRSESSTLWSFIWNHDLVIPYYHMGVEYTRYITYRFHGCICQDDLSCIEYCSVQAWSHTFSLRHISLRWACEHIGMLKLSQLNSLGGMLYPKF